jgi:hypothetical protein
MPTTSATIKNKGLAEQTTNPPTTTKRKAKFTDNSTNNQLSTAINCDRYNSCSANVCPLDSNWQKRKHLNGERVCFYLIEAQKANAKAVFDTRGRGYLYTLMQEATQAIITRHCYIKHVLEQAKKSGLRMGRKFGVSHELMQTSPIASEVL